MANSFSLSNAGATPASSGVNTSSLTLPKTYSGPTIATTSPTVTNNTSGFVAAGNQPSTLSTPKPVTVPGMLPTTPVKSIATPDGTTTTFHPPEADAASKSAGKATDTPSYNGPSYAGLVGTDARVTPSATQYAANNEVNDARSSATVPSTTVSAGTEQPVNSTATSNTNTVPIDPATGQPYSNHTTTLQSAANAVNSARQPTADETYYNNMAVSAKQLQNINTLSPYGDAKMYGGTGQQLAPGLGAFDFAPERASDTGLATSLGNIFGSAAQTGETNAIAQQQQNLGGAEALLNSAAPQTQFGQLTNPYTGEPVSGGTVTNNPLLNNAVNQAAQLVVNGASINDPTVQALVGPYGAPGIQALTSLLQQSSGGQFNPTTQAAAAGANAQNVGTAATSDTQAAAQGYASTLPVYQGATTAFSTASTQANNLLSTMKNLGINSSDAQDWNTAFNAASSKLGSTKIPAFTATLAEAQQAYTNLLSSVGAATPTVNGEQATAIFNPSSTPAQIAQAIDALNQAAYTKLAPQYQQALTYYNQLHNTSVNAIPGYPAPVLPTSVATNAPQGADTSAGNLATEGGVAAGGGLLHLGGQILDHITTIIPGLIP